MNERDALYEAKRQLNEGNVILCPSDTIWSLSVDATNFEAVQKIINIKSRSVNKSFIVLVNSDRMLNQCFKDIPEVAWDLVDFSEQPLTLVLGNGQFVAPNVINQNGSLAVRMVKSGTSFELLKIFNKPILSTSPNFSGDITPDTFEKIDSRIIEKVDYLYPKRLAKGMNSRPSKIISIGMNGEVKVLRK